MLNKTNLKTSTHFNILDDGVMSLDLVMKVQPWYLQLITAFKENSDTLKFETLDKVINNGVVDYEQLLIALNY